MVAACGRLEKTVPVDYVMIWSQRFGGLDGQFERFKRLQSMTVMSRYAKRSVQAVSRSGLFDNFA